MGIFLEFCAVSKETEDCASILDNANIHIAIDAEETEFTPPHGKKITAYKGSIVNGSAIMSANDLKNGNLKGRPVTSIEESIEATLFVLSKNFFAAASKEQGGAVAVFEPLQCNVMGFNVFQYEKDKGLKIIDMGFCDKDKNIVESPREQPNALYPHRY